MAEVNSRSSRAGRWLWGWAKSIAIALVAWFLLSRFVIQAFHVPTPSMEQTVLVGDFLFVNKFLYGAPVPFTHAHLPAVREPRRDEVVVVESPIEDLTLLKRIVGLPGDTLSMADGYLSRNGTAVVEPYVTRLATPPEIDPVAAARMREWQLPFLVGRDRDTYHPDPRNWGPLVVPPGFFMAMGDNRDESFDSRFYGFIPRQNLRGAPLFIYFSYDPSSYRPLPFLTAIRWGRILTSPF